MTLPEPGEPQWVREDEPPDGFDDGSPEYDEQWYAAEPRAVAPAVLVWLLTAVLAVVAPFLTLSEVHLSGLRETSNGWGQVDVHSDNPLSTGSYVGHSTRIGVLFAVGAAVLIIATVGWLSRTHRVAAVFGLIGSAVVVVSAGVVALTAEAVQSVSTRDQTFDFGPGLWCSVVAGVVALVGAALAARELLRDT